MVYRKVSKDKNVLLMTMLEVRGEYLLIKGLVPVIRPPGEAVGSEGLGTGAAGEQAQAPSLAAECGAGERRSFRILSLCIEPFCDSSVSKYQLRGDLFLTSL